MDYTIDDFKEIFQIILPYIRHSMSSYKKLEDFSVHPFTYEVLSASLEDVPLFIHSPISHVCEVAKWRLEHNK